ncbi:MAG: TetR/AcrR family transcriptional regulator, partial [Chloroflexi bacterium]|nr:TetR/AcrR family transcriptional regulator [Chloroflexota bacterium]
IAQAAGVALRTVYAVFGTKRAILEALRQAWLAQSGLWDLLRQSLDEPDLNRRLEVAARWTRQQYEGGQSVLAIYEAAAHADPEMRDAYREAAADRAREIVRFIASFAGGLAPGLDECSAAAIFRALTGVAVYRELVDEGGWPPERYQAWLASTLQRQLLDSV